jgi:predicted dehydrogenase
MTQQTRRRFFEDSLIAAAVTAAAASTVQRVVAEEETHPAANDEIQHAVIGCRIRGKVHAAEFGRQAGVNVACVCDPDLPLAEELADAVKEKSGKRPTVVQDLRKIFDDKTINTVSIAAPNHWHALAAIWAMQSGKDVYVEKPVSHNIAEGRRMVQAARKTNRICQGGTQNRSSGALKEASEFLGRRTASPSRSC